MPLLHPAPSLDDVSDAELIGRVRAGDVGSYGTLFARHRAAANRLAHSLTQQADADDVVADAFAKVLTALQDGKGPDEAFRPYLLTAVRTCHIDRRRHAARMTPTDDAAVFDGAGGFDGGFADPAVAGFEGGAALAAFRSLPERWQLVLWHLDVEGQKPAAVAPLLGMAPNAVSALAYRAREGLRQAFLQQHAAEAATEECRRTHDLLGAAVRGGLARRDQKRVEAHLEHCRPCTALYLELTEVNSSMRALIAPLVLGGAAAAYLAGSTGAGTGLTGVAALLGRARDAVTSHAQTALAAGATIAAGAAAVTGMVLLHTDVGHSDHGPQADAPVSMGPPSAVPQPIGEGPGNTPPRHSAPSAVAALGLATPLNGTRPGIVRSAADVSSSTPASGPRQHRAPTQTAAGGATPPGSPGSPGSSAAPPGRPSGSPTPSNPGPSDAGASTVTVSAGVLPGGTSGQPLRVGLDVGPLPAAHLLTADLDVLGQPLVLSVP